jgi:hypothetical protein
VKKILAEDNFFCVCLIIVELFLFAAVSILAFFLIASLKEATSLSKTLLT